MTVSELIDFLSHYPKDLEVMIFDADTEWYMPVHLSLYGPYSCIQVRMPVALYLYGDYSEAIK